MSFPTALFCPRCGRRPRRSRRKRPRSTRPASRARFPFLNFVIFLSSSTGSFFLWPDFLSGSGAPTWRPPSTRRTRRPPGRGGFGRLSGRLAKLAEELRAIRELFRRGREKEKARLLTEAERSRPGSKPTPTFSPSRRSGWRARSSGARSSKRPARPRKARARDDLNPADQKRMVGDFLSQVGAPR
jgi:hypothetical protein